MSDLTRRDVLRQTGIGAAALLLSPLVGKVRAADASGFTLPKLPYAFDALEPHIDARTMEIHHDRHHQGYVNNLNKALEGSPDLLATPIEKLIGMLDKVPEKVRTAVRNNGGGHYNHSLFWQMMAPSLTKAPRMPGGELAKAIDSDLGGVEKFQESFNQAAGTRFGSGWAWLVYSKGKLAVESSANQDSPWSAGRFPLLGIDVWEHAYYLKYQNKRPDYVKAWWNVVNWDFVAERYKEAKKA